MSATKNMSVAEFRKLGLLQELNRRFLHPMGLALEVVVNHNLGEESFGEVWDCSDDPEGVAFDAVDVAKAETVDAMFESKRATREKILGWHVQPVSK